MRYEIQYIDGIFEVKTFGNAELQCFKDLIEAIFAHEQWRPDCPVLVDHTDLNGESLSTDNLLEVAAFGNRFKTIVGKSKFAILVSRDLEFGIGRMWQVFALEGRSSYRKVFRSREEAITWLKEA